MQGAEHHVCDNHDAWLQVCKVVQVAKTVQPLWLSHTLWLQVCKVAPVPGETKVWQYNTLTKRIFLVDCPGVVSDPGRQQHPSQ